MTGAGVSGDDDSEVEMGSEMDYGEEEMMSEGDSEGDNSEGELLPQQEGAKVKGKKQKKKSSDATFASYEEFAHLLDPESDEDTKGKAHFKKNPIGQKRSYEDRRTNFQTGGRRGRPNKRHHK